MTALRFKVETVLHDGLPFRSVWSWSLPPFAGLPVNDQVSYFVGDGVNQEIGEILGQQLLVDAQAGLAVASNSGLAGASAA